MLAEQGLCLCRNYIGSLWIIFLRVDVTKQIDALEEQGRIVIGKRKGAQKKSTGKYGEWGANSVDGTFNVTVPTSPIACKYEGYVYGIAPLKQTVEEILVFRKNPLDTVPKDIIKLEKSKELSEIHPSVLNLKKTSIPSDNGLKWTPQLMVAEEIIPRLLEHPRISHTKGAKFKETVKIISTHKSEAPYCLEPKVKCNDKHVSPKPLSVVRWVIDLFKPPDNILIVDTFMGTGTIPYVCKEKGIDYIGIELDEKIFNYAKEFIEGSENNLTLF